MLPQYKITLVTGPLAKASHHEHPLKLCRTFPHAPSLNQNRLARIPRRQAHTRFRPPDGHHTPPGATRLQHHHCIVTAGRTPPCRHRLTHLPAPPGATALSGPLLYHTAWRNYPYRQAPCVNSGHCHWFVFRPLGGSLSPPSAIPVAQCYWLWHLKHIPMDLKSYHTQLIKQFGHTKHSSISRISYTPF